MADVKQNATRRRGAELSSRICRWSTSSATGNTLQLTVQNGAKLLPDVPKGTRGTKSKYVSEGKVFRQHGLSGLMDHVRV